MNPLLRPAREPHPNVLSHMLGITGRSVSIGFDGFKAMVAHVCNECRRLTRSETDTPDQVLTEGERTLVTCLIERQGEGTAAPTGNLSFAYNGRTCTLTAKLLWAFLPMEIGELVATLDRLWSSRYWSAVYAYDEDDFSLQNATAVPGMEHWGLDRAQVRLVKRFGVVEEIDSRGNPGYMLNHGGMLWSVQWLNYWSKDSQERIFAEAPTTFPPGVEVAHLNHGSIRMRVREKPGRYDDIEFHERQLQCRFMLPFRSPFGEMV